MIGALANQGISNLEYFTDWTFSMSMRIDRIFVVVFLLCHFTLFTRAATLEPGWMSLFDGKSLSGWTANENSDSCKVVDGLIVLNGLRSHLFYTGPVQNHNFADFQLKMEVMTRPGSNSGVFFHTKYQDAGSLNHGYEAQVNATHSDPRRTGSIFKVKDLEESPAVDNEWFEFEIEVVGQQITVKVNGKVVNQYIEPVNLVPPQNRPGRKLSSGTIALQAHDPGSTVYFRNIRIKTPTTEAAAIQASWSASSGDTRKKCRRCCPQKRLFKRRCCR